MWSVADGVMRLNLEVVSREWTEAVHRGRRSTFGDIFDDPLGVWLRGIRCQEQQVA